MLNLVFKIAQLLTNKKTAVIQPKLFLNLAFIEKIYAIKLMLFQMPKTCIFLKIIIFSAQHSLTDHANLPNIFS